MAFDAPGTIRIPTRKAQDRRYLLCWNNYETLLADLLEPISGIKHGRSLARCLRFWAEKLESVRETEQERLTP
jgi:hypothetical protein